MLTACEVRWEKGQDDLPTATITARGQVRKEHELLSALELCDDFSVERLDEARVRVVFKLKPGDGQADPLQSTIGNRQSAITSSPHMLSLGREELLEEAAHLGIGDQVGPKTHMATLRRLVFQARSRPPQSPIPNP